MRSTQTPSPLEWHDASTRVCTRCVMSDTDPDITFDAIDDRGQQQGSVTFFGTFPRCDNKSAPKPFVNGKSYTSCITYLMPGGGSIQKMQWNDGPAKGEAVTPYFDNPVVWSAS